MWPFDYFKRKREEKKRLAIEAENKRLQELKKKYLSQYQNISFTHNNSFHDRFIVIDKQVLYHCGSSFKDLGKKCFAISKIEDINILNNLIKEIYK